MCTATVTLKSPQGMQQTEVRGRAAQVIARVVELAETLDQYSKWKLVFNCAGPKVQAVQEYYDE